MSKILPAHEDDARAAASSPPDVAPHPDVSGGPPLRSQVDAASRHVWESVSHSPLHSLWDFQGVPLVTVLKRTATSFTNDNLLSRAAELGYYFLFALFPTLISASAIFGLFARSAGDIYVKLLNYLSLVVPHDALGLVLDTFQQTTQHSTSGKITFGIAAAIWSASVGFSAIQDTLNTVYKVKETRPYWMVRGSAMLVTVLLAMITLATLGALLAGTLLSHLVREHIAHPQLGLACGIAVHLVFDVVCLALNLLLFATIYYFGPNVQNKRWRYFTPGAAIGIVGWILSSLALRVYLFYFNSYSVTYGSLGAVIILLTWFYITGLMLLLGAELNSEIEAAATEKRLKASGTIPRGAKTAA
jgi:membrane protein